MRFKEQPKIEQLSEAKKRLLDLEKEGKYVFHGSLENIKSLEPRQAYSFGKKDSAPSVFATPFAEVAIFRALINEKALREDSESEFGMDEKDRLHFSATQNLLDRAKKSTGKVYVLDKSKFEEFKGVQCRSEESVEPIEALEVKAQDLPENIKVIK
jgi:hypothetical protein